MTQDATENNQRIESTNYADIVFPILKSSFFLILRSTSIFTQVISKRIILAQKDQELLAIFGGLVALEDFIFMFSLSSIAFTSTITSQVHAQSQDAKKIGALYRSVLVFTTGLIGITGGLCLMAPWIFQFTNQPDEIIENSGPYFQIAFFAYTFDFLYRGLARLKIGLSDAKSAFIADAMEGFLDIFFTYIFIIKLDQGIKGSAWAYFFSSLITLLAYSTYIYFDNKMSSFELFQMKSGLYQFKKFVISSLHIGFAASLEYLVQFMMTFYCGLSGSVALLAMQAAANYSLCATFMTSGFLDAAAMRVAHYYGRKNAVFRKIGNVSIIIAAFYASLCALLFICFSGNMLSLFVNKNKISEANYQLVVNLVLVQAMTEIFNSVRNASTDMLSACNKTGFPFLTNTTFVFFLNGVLATSSQFFLKQNLVSTYATQLVGFAFAALIISGGWLLHDKDLKISDKCHSFWFKKPTVIDIELSDSKTIVIV